MTDLIRLDYAELHMGVKTTISCYARTQEEGDRAVRAAFDRIAALEDVASDYRPASEVRRLTEAFTSRPVRLSQDLWRLLERSQAVARDSGGAFDVTCGPYVALWRQSRRTGRMAPWPAFVEARERTGWQKLELDPARRTARGLTAGLAIDLGGIAKGDAMDQALDVLRRMGVSRALVHAGGDMAASEAPPGQKGWHVQADDLPSGEIWLRNEALSTSGDVEQHVDIAGVRYSHIVDPRTGFGLTNRYEVTVLARRGLTSDPLAKVACVLGPRKCLPIMRRWGAKVWFRRAVES